MNSFKGNEWMDAQRNCEWGDNCHYPNCNCYEPIEPSAWWSISLALLVMAGLAISIAFVRFFVNLVLP